VAAGCLALLRELRAELPFLTSCYHRLKPIDLLIVAGSNQFLDNFGGPAGFPLTLLKWTILCKLSGTRIAFVSVGAGPIYSPLSKRLIRTSLFFADYRSYRDAASRQLIEGDTGRPKGELFPDLASNLSFRAAARKRATTDKPTVGINPMPMYDRRYWHETDDGKYGAYVEKLAMLAARLMADGYPVFFFGTQPKDYNVIDDIVPRLPAVDAGATTLVRDATSVQELMTVICGADIVVATRFHGTVLPLVAGVPVLGICYYRKAADLMREMGQEEYFVMLDDFEVDEVYEKYRLLEANLDTERRKIEQASRRNRERLERQYEHLASVFVGRASSGGKARHAGYRLRRILSRT
jgi:polysaccharide pyruvyl transferase WcaK-like protein